jgi:hypothetical protein
MRRQYLNPPACAPWHRPAWCGTLQKTVRLRYKHPSAIFRSPDPSQRPGFFLGIVRNWTDARTCIAYVKGVARRELLQGNGGCYLSCDASPFPPPFRHRRRPLPHPVEWTEVSTLRRVRMATEMAEEGVSSTYLPFSQQPPSHFRHLHPLEQLLLQFLRCT